MMKRITLSLLLLTVTASLNGCASMTDSMISCEMGIRNQVLSHKAWGHWSWCYDQLESPYHFGKGFRAGYRNILDGGNGCQPTLPPQNYWKPYYQTPEGHGQTHAWFDGFSHGALAAKQDGYGFLGEIPISPTARANFEKAQQRRPHDDYYNQQQLTGPDGGPLLEPLADPYGDPGVILPAPNVGTMPHLPSQRQLDGSMAPDPRSKSIPLRPYE